jgi:phosphoglycerate kinase
MKKMQDLDLRGKRVIIRQDLNVPMKDGRISNDKRIRAALPTIQMALEKGAGVLLLSHLGRPVEGEFDTKFSLAPVAAHLGALLGQEVTLYANIASVQVKPGTVGLLENIRFQKGEKKNDPALAATLAGLGDVYVMDAFGAAHRAHASTEGAVRKAALACAGPLMAAELEAFAKVLTAPKSPFAAIIGGSKVSTKLGVLE